MSLSDIFLPEWDNLLIRPDNVSDVVGVGLDGGTLVRPESVTDVKPHTGVVVSAGPDCHPVYQPGVRVVFGIHDGSELLMDGEKLKLVPQPGILARTDGGEDPERILDEDWKEHLIPPPGQMLLERAAQPLRRGPIIIPDGIRLVNRSGEASVVAMEDDDGRFAKNDRVFIHGTVSRRIPLGLREDTVLWVTRPREVAGRLLDEPSEAIERRESPHLAAVPELQREALDLREFEEGDTRAPR